MLLKTRIYPMLGVKLKLLLFVHLRGYMGNFRLTVHYLTGVKGSALHFTLIPPADETRYPLGFDGFRVRLES